MKRNAIFVASLLIAASVLAPRSGAGVGRVKVMVGGAPRPLGLFQTGTGPLVTLSSASLIFGNQQLGTTSSAQTVTLSNTGDSPLNIASITATGDFQAANSCGSSLAAGGYCSIAITFAPTATGTRTGEVNITDDAASSPQTIGLTGTGGVPTASLSKTSLTFTPKVVGSTSKVQTVTLTNNGNAQLNVATISTTGDFAQTNNCGTTIAVASSCTISVTFTPTAAGPRPGTLLLNDNATPSGQTVKLSGAGVLVALNPTALTFPAGPIGIPSAPKPVVLTNYDPANSYAISGISASGDFAVTNNCGTAIGPNASCTVYVTCTPTQAGTRLGKLVVSDTAYGSPQTTGLNGKGTSTFVVSLSVTPPDRSIGVGETQSFTATASMSDGSSIPVTNSVSWTSSNPAAVSLTANVATAVASGQSTISISNGSITGSTTLNVSNVSVTPKIATLTFTQTQQFQASTTGDSASPIDWYVDGIRGGNSDLGTISPTGLYTPPQSVGQHRVSANFESDGSQTGWSTVIVTDYAGTLTYNNDNLRTSQNTNEQILSPANVNHDQFGKLFSYSIDGFAYAQPLYMENVFFPGSGYHNVVFLATEHDSVYAFDADGLSLAPLWHDSFIDPANGIVPPPGIIGGSEIGGESGITGTPVIDPATGTLYVAVRTVENSVYFYRLHALDITTGAEKFGGPVVIQASVPGSATHGSTVPFFPQYNHNRPALLLDHGIVYIAFGLLGCETCTYSHGWMFAYDSQTLNLVGVLSTSPNAYGASIWQSGDGPAADADGNVYVETGNGWFDADTGGSDFGFSVLKYTMVNGTLSVTDWFTPYNWPTMLPDYDLGSCGALLLPDQPGTHPHLVVADGKKGMLYLIDRDNMGKFNATADQVVQEFPAAGGIWGKWSYWGNRVYASNGSATYFYIYTLNNGLLQASSPVKKSIQWGYPGPIPAISSSGANNGILWLIQTHGYVLGGYPAVLHAYDAINGLEIYNSSQAGTRDTAGKAVKFTVPTVANGKVYMGTQNELDVYGLLPK